MSVTIVTGASRGLGLAICQLILKKDSEAKVVAVARSGDQLSDLAAKFAPRVLSIAGDVTDSSVVKQTVEKTIAKFGRIDSVVLNAGLLDPVGHIAELNVDHVRRLYEVNLFSVIDLVAQTLPYVRETGGNFLFVSSGASIKPVDGWSAYGSSKAALNLFCASVSEEEPKVRTISLAPGTVDTAMQQDIREKFKSGMKPEAHKRFTDLHKRQELLPPDVPGTLYANLALQGIPQELSGKYFRYNDDKLTKYAA
ncbi:hypothetical protein OGAPHI_003774 [Ogataea philodendri]|uniref:Ketoreductase domain-containing protein n=1 Tax=Ogataea philodendri TaxID=1378263 RepID=A0A9P8P5D8_9ASCO|nr:uncharacterized protein OGAPHI_003774 [Ogataea philodendri]KAH3665587.1 hypothetical protein OGAPHI_003774 [Ogataea philodendri]